MSRSLLRLTAKVAPTSVPALKAAISVQSRCAAPTKLKYAKHY